MVGELHDRRLLERLPHLEVDATTDELVVVPSSHKPKGKYEILPSSISGAGLGVFSRRNLKLQADLVFILPIEGKVREITYNSDRCTAVFAHDPNNILQTPGHTANPYKMVRVEMTGVASKINSVSNRAVRHSANVAIDKCGWIRLERFVSRGEELLADYAEIL